jgi:hypothetical protein
MFVRPQVIISEARGDANWMFAKTRAPSEAVQKSVSRGKAPTSIKASEPSSPPRGDVAPMWGGESLFRGVLCKGRGLRCWPISNSVRSEASGSYLEERASCANLRPTPGESTPRKIYIALFAIFCRNGGATSGGGRFVTQFVARS